MGEEITENKKCCLRLKKGWFFGKWTASRVGVWIWGAVAIFCISCVAYVVTTGRPENVYDRYHEFASVLGPLIASMTLAWSWFYQTYNKQKENRTLAKRVEELENKIEDLKKGNL